MTLNEKALRGAGGGGGSSSQSSPTESPDTLKSTALARIVDIIAEGELGGFHHGLSGAMQDVYLNETRVMNADGSLNFQNVVIDSRTGLPSQSFMPGFPDTENEVAVNVKLRNTTDWTQAITNLSATSARVTLGVPQLLKSNASNGDIGDYSISYEIDLQTDAGSFVAIVSSAITGKTTSKFQKSHSFALPAATTGWTIKVRRLTANLNLATTQDTMTVDSYAEIVDVKVRYSNLAVVGIILDSEQFSSIPSRAYDLYGRIISVPSNYDPVARTYTGTWDGTFKPAWTNNPAWIYYDAITNDRFGLGNRISAALVDKWTIYTISQYCDQLVPDLKGGTEPRFTAFLYEQAKTDAATFLNNLTSIFRGIAYWAGGSVQLSADMPSSVEYIYTPANVIDGYFKYEGSQRKTRYTVAEVDWNDPSDFGRVKTAYVPYRPGLARYGIRPIAIKASGATSIGQAIRMGLWTLYTSCLDDQTCTFKVGLDGVLVAPGTIVGVADPAKAGKRMGGRIHSATTTAVTVDRAPDLGAAGDTLMCAMPGGTSESHPILSIVGNVITVSSAFTVAPNAEAMWYVSAAALVPAQYRVISVGDPANTGNPHYTITALLHNESKFAAVDAGMALSVDQTVYNAANTLTGPPAVALSSHVVTGNAMLTSVLDIAWDAAPGAISYDVQYRCNLGGWVTRTAVPGLLLSIPGMSPGTYDAQVRANAPSGGRSQPVAAASYALPDPTQLPASISNLNTEVANAQQSATLANAELANIASDSMITSAEKPTVIRDYAVITAEQSGIDAQAVSFLGAGSADQVAYDNAITALTNYLATLTTPKAWNDKTGDTTVVGATFRGNFNTVYTTRQTLLNAIYAKAQTLANNAQGTANTANTNANTAVGQVTQLPVINGGFDIAPTGYGWAADSGTWFTDTTSISPGVQPNCARRNGNATTPVDVYRNTGLTPVYPGQVVKSQALIKAVGADGSCWVRITWRDGSNAEFSSTNGNAITGTTTAGSYVVGVAPTGAVFAKTELEALNHTVGYYLADNVVCTQYPSNQSEVPNGGGHNSVTAIDGNGLALIDFTQAGHVSKNLDNIGDGATYGRMYGTDLTGNRLDFSKGLLNKQLDNMPDGAVYYRMPAANMDANRRGLVDFSQVGHVNKTQDFIADTGTYVRTTTRAKDLVDNGDFEASTSITPPPGWTTSGAFIVAPASISYYTGAPYAGSQSLLITGPQYAGVQALRSVPVIPGETYLLSGAAQYNSGPAGGYAMIGVFFVDKTGAALSEGSITTLGTANATWSYGSVAASVPANAFSVALVARADGAAGTATVLFDSISFTRVRSIDSEVSDGTTYARMPAANMDVNRRGLVDFSQVGHVNKTLDNIGDGPTYGRMYGTDLTGSRLDFSKGLLNKHLGNIPDYGGRYAAVQANADNTASNTASDTAHVNGATAASISDGAGRAQLGFTSAGYLVAGRHSTDLLADGSAFQRSSVAQATGINVVENGHFGIAALASENAGTPFSRWVVFADTNSWWSFVTNSNTADPLSIRLSSGVSINNGATVSGWVTNGQSSTNTFTCRGGESFLLGGTSEIYAPNGWPSGVTATASINVAWFDRTGAYISGSTGSSVTQSAGAADRSGIITAPTNAAFGSVQIKADVANASGAAYVTGSGAMYFNFGDVYCRRISDLDTETQDGTTYARIYGSDLSGGRHKLTVAGSGMQVGDNRNLMPILTAGAQATWQNLTISATTAAGSPATATISVGAAQILGLIAAGGLVSYNASSAGVTGTGGSAYTYYLYYLDQTLAGGTQTLQVTTSTATLRGQLGVVYIGSITFTYPTSGTGSGGGFGGLCVTDDMWISDALHAGDAVPGDLFDCVDWPTGQGKHQRGLLGVTRGVEECVRITTDCGAILHCSVTTPFDTPDGRELMAPQMLGESVLTDWGLERVASVEPIGPHPVSRIHLGGISYAAGVNPTHRIYSHNGVKP